VGRAIRTEDLVQVANPSYLEQSVHLVCRGVIALRLPRDSADAGRTIAYRASSDKRSGPHTAPSGELQRERRCGWRGRVRRRGLEYDPRRDVLGSQRRPAGQRRIRLWVRCRRARAARLHWTAQRVMHVRGCRSIHRPRLGCLPGRRHDSDHPAQRGDATDIISARDVIVGAAVGGSLGVVIHGCVRARRFMACTRPESRQ